MKRPILQAATWLLLAAPALGSCSLLGLDQFTIPHCTTNAECEPVNQHENIGPDAMRRYQCRPSTTTCELTLRDRDGDGDPAIEVGGTDCDDTQADVYASGGGGDGGMLGPHPEVCDGKDNDCNGLVDENPVSGRGLTSAVALPQMAPVDRIVISQPTSQVIATFQSLGSASTAGFAGTSVTVPSTPLGFGIRTLPSADNFTGSATCPRSGASLSGCTIVDAAIDGLGTQIVAGVSQVGCATGMLYVGYQNPGGGATSVVLRNYEGLSNTFLGIDRPAGCTTGTLECTCTAGGTECADRGTTGHTFVPGDGASRPALAAMQPATGHPQALVTYLAVPSSAGYQECGGPLVDVRALGVYLMEVPGNDTHWITGTGDGRSVRLGQSRGGAAAVATYGDRGYFAAYGNAAGDISIHFVPKFADATLSSGTNPDVMSTDATCGDSGSAGGAHYIDTPPFPMTFDGTVTAHGMTGQANHVAIGLSPQSGANVDVGLAWVESCGQAGSSVWFSRVRYDIVTHVFTRTDPVQISPNGIRAEAPSVVYVDHGFVRAGFVRGGSTADRDGGFYVAYVDRSQNTGAVRLRRVAQFDGVVTPEPPINITDPTVNVAVGSPRLYTLSNASAEPVSFVYASNSGASQGIVGGQLECHP